MQYFILALNIIVIVYWHKIYDHLNNLEQTLNFVEGKLPPV